MNNIGVQISRLQGCMIRIVMPVLLCMFTAVATPDARAQVNAEQVISIGRNVLSMDDYVLSIHYFNLAIKAKPYLADPYYLRAVAKVMLEDYQGAERDATLAIERNKYLTEAYRVRGYARQRLEQDSLALADFNIGLSYLPVDRSFLYYKGASETALKRYDDAKRTFALLLRYFPNFEGAYAERARLNLLSGDTAAALADIDTTLMKDKSQSFPYLLRAGIAFDRRDWTQARTDLDKAIELNPKQTDLYLNRAYARYNDDDYFGAMSDYNYILELDPTNSNARYNRALLRYEVRDYSGSQADFSEVLKTEPANFHARYARGLIDLDLGQWRKAVEDFNAITAHYPKFYPAYYALAQAYQRMGNNSAAIANYNKAENLVRLYVTNPRKNPLDRPTIRPGETNTTGTNQREDETEIDVMNRFNELVTVSSSTVQPEMTYQESLRGNVQDREMKVEPFPLYVLSLYDNPSELRPSSNYFKEIMELNENRLLPYKIYLTNSDAIPSDRDEVEHLFDLANQLTIQIDKGNPRPVDYFGRALLMYLLKDYDGAIADYGRALVLKQDMTSALMGRSAAFAARAAFLRSKKEVDAAADNALEMGEVTADLRSAMEDLDETLRLDPRMVYAWFNKGTLYYGMGDYTSALECFNKALGIYPDFPEAHYNRGLTYLRLGNKQAGRTDLSRAGELGIMPSYSLLKRMQ